MQGRPNLAVITSPEAVGLFMELHIRRAHISNLEAGKVIGFPQSASLETLLVITSNNLKVSVKSLSLSQKVNAYLGYVATLPLDQQKMYLDKLKESNMQGDVVVNPNESLGVDRDNGIINDDPEPNKPGQERGA
ncbi:MAG: hypothetical protein WBL28_08000 [Methylotenera sp.]